MQDEIHLIKARPAQPKRFPWTLLIVGLTLLPLVVCPISISLGYFGTHYFRPIAPDAVKPLVGEKRADDWNWQDLQDRLASKGMKTTRFQGPGGMHFFPGDVKLNAYVMSEIYKAHGLSDGEFAVKMHGSAKEAKESAAQIRDVRQEDRLQWGRFVFEARPETRAELAKLLN